MEKFTAFDSLVAVLPVDNIDTDQIIPARFLKTISKAGLGDQLFFDWRYEADGSPKPDFVINRAPGNQAQVLLAGDNFGCGSSREHAPWALTQFGFRAVISLKNSLLPIVVPRDIHARLLGQMQANPQARVQVDLASQTLTLPDGAACQFPVDAFSKTCLLEGVDELGFLLKHEAQIAAFEAATPAAVDTLSVKL
jgi:3-isopropylmalate/(R)-2-methylmalate dehydratase small subunit